MTRGMFRHNFTIKREFRAIYVLFRTALAIGRVTLSSTPQNGKPKTAIFKVKRWQFIGQREAIGTLMHADATAVLISDCFRKLGRHAFFDTLKSIFPCKTTSIYGHLGLVE
jgi:hypothetical protein